MKAINNSYQQNTMWNQTIPPLTTCQISSLRSASHNINNGNSSGSIVLNYPNTSPISLSDILKATNNYQDGKYVKTYSIINYKL
jgi:hypothetical protein